MDFCTTDIVLMQGMPASGKSSITAFYSNDGYLVFSRDNVGGPLSGMLSRIEENPKNKIVIDATFHTIESRKPFIELAKKMGKTIGCHVKKTSKDDCLINAILRVKKITGEFYFHDSQIPSQWKGNPQIFVFPAIFKQAKELKYPKLSEGFDEIMVDTFRRIWIDGYTNKAVFIDLDGTVRETLDDSKWPIKLKNQRILPNTIKVLKEYKEKGYLIIGVSNQSDVNKGRFIDPVDDIIKETNTLMGDLMDDYIYCPHSMPAQICVCRKPQSGMALKLRDKHKLDFSKCIMVGDRTTDKTFAGRLDIEYFDHAEFFNR